MMANLKRSLSNGKHNICTFQCYNKSDNALLKVGMLLYRQKIKSFFAPQKEKKPAHTCTAITCFSFCIFGGTWNNRE